jgi:choline dehydrogenase-like flavoprotein
VEASRRSRGVGLIVGDISLVPASLTNNTNSSAYMIGERIADLIEARPQRARPVRLG